MAHSDHQCEVTRRTFIKAGATTAAAAGLPLSALADDDKKPGDKPKHDVLPRRVLGRTGAKVTILNYGAGRPPSTRMLNATYDSGIRYLDTAKIYGRGESEKAIAEWMKETKRRDEFFIVTKVHDARTPEDWIKSVDARLEALQTDYIDLFFLHALGEAAEEGADVGKDWPKMKEWAAAADTIKKTGKVKAVGFSTHAEMDMRNSLLNNAVEGGWVDAIMVSYDPKTVRENAEFNKALDACHKAGIGLISMKEMRGVDDMPEIMPEFKDMGLSPYQAVLQAVWSDERIASICSDMPNLHCIDANSTAARKFKKPLDAEKVGAVIELYDRYASGFCNSCDGSCRRAGKTNAALSDIARSLSYFERDGMREEGRKLYASLTPEQRDWRDADLEAASHACHCKLDFASILPRAEEKLA